MSCCSTVLTSTTRISGAAWPRRWLLHRCRHFFAFDIRLDELRADQPHPVPYGSELSSPVMGADAHFHGNVARGERDHKDTRLPKSETVNHPSCRPQLQPSRCALSAETSKSAMWTSQRFRSITYAHSRYLNSNLSHGTHGKVMTQNAVSLSP